MDNKTQKERLEQELRFLNESFEAEVISKDEFQKGKDRIEKKLKEIQSQEKPVSKEPEEALEKQEPEEQKEEQIKEEEEKQELKEEQEKEQISKEQEKSEEIKYEPSEPAEEEKISLETKAEAEKDEEEKIEEEREAEEKAEETIQEEPAMEISEEKEDKKDKFFKYAVVFVVLALIIYFSYFFLKSEKAAPENKSLTFVAACSSDNDCRQEGKEGSCLNPGTKNAKCEFKEIQKTNVVVLNDRKSCFNCDTSRVLNILEDLFGAINIEEIDYNTDDGKALAERFGAGLLPMYILDENITNKPKFEQFKQIFAKKDNSYVLSEDAAGSTLYFKRDNVPDKLDLFVISGDSAGIRTEKNLKEFLDEFKDVKFDKHLSNDQLTQELKIKTFPAFLINNRVKFGGVQTAETIKENFCKLNKLEACGKNLSKSLV